MQVRAADIDSAGIESLLGFAQDPTLLGQDGFRGSQVYMPGIFIPGHETLQEPFSVPIIGDNESTSLTIDWPVKGDSPYYKRIALAAMLPAEDCIRGEPLDEDQTSIEEQIEFDDRHEQLNTALDEYTGEWGGFLYAAVGLSVLPKVARGMAEFIVFESSEDFDAIHAILETGVVSAAEVVSITRLRNLMRDPSLELEQHRNTTNELPPTF